MAQTAIKLGLNSVFSPQLEQLQFCFTMSDINDTRLPLVLLLFPLIPCVGEDTNATLTRADT